MSEYRHGANKLFRELHAAVTELLHWVWFCNVLHPVL